MDQEIVFWIQSAIMHLHSLLQMNESQFKKKKEEETVGGQGWGKWCQSQDTRAQGHHSQGKLLDFIQQFNSAIQKAIRKRNTKNL